MMRLRLAALLALLLLFAPGSVAAQDSFDGVARIVAVGDVHGDFDRLVEVLRDAGVVDRRNRWTGGGTHLVQTGDVLDRGPDARKVLDLLMSLEKQARRAGGRVHALLGNHEAMNLAGDLRYVPAGEYAAFRSPETGELRARVFELLADPASKDDAAYRARWEAQHPLGWVERSLAFGPKGAYGKWLRQRAAVVRINGILFLHGGLSPKHGSLSIPEINQRIEQELAGTALPEGSLAADPEGPLWYRGLATLPEPELREHVDRLLSLHQARHIVIGHTVVAPAIVPRLSARVIAIDVGLSALYKGPPAALIVEGERLFALHRGHRLPLPVDGRLRAYLEAAAKLDPAPSPILEVIDKLAPVAEPVLR
ncbi:MAG: metallophosphoesterase [Acidobacteria bacterium]|nr:metallophosphoesterase [Acidobacteriota bacterium]